MDVNREKWASTGPRWGQGRGQGRFADSGAQVAVGLARNFSSNFGKAPARESDMFRTARTIVSPEMRDIRIIPVGFPLRNCHVDLRV